MLTQKKYELVDQVYTLSITGEGKLSTEKGILKLTNVIKDRDHSFGKRRFYSRHEAYAILEEKYNKAKNLVAEYNGSIESSFIDDNEATFIAYIDLGEELWVDTIVMYFYAKITELQ